MTESKRCACGYELIDANSRFVAYEDELHTLERCGPSFVLIADTTKPQRVVSYRWGPGPEEVRA